MPPKQAIKQIWDFMTKSGKCFETNLKKFELVSAGEGSCVAKFKVAEEHTNRYGTLHGGMTATIVDNVSSMALIATEPYESGVSVDLSVSYLRAAQIGEEVTVSAQTLKAGKNLAFLTVDLHDSQGRLVAQGRHTKYTGEKMTSL